jgi:hypothetical protein
VLLDVPVLSSAAMKAYAILTAEGWYTPSRSVTHDGPPKLYKTEANAQRLIDTAWTGSQIEGGAVVEIEWRYNL